MNEHHEELTEWKHCWRQDKGQLRMIKSDRWTDMIKDLRDEWHLVTNQAVRVPSRPSTVARNTRARRRTCGSGSLSRRTGGRLRYGTRWWCRHLLILEWVKERDGMRSSPQFGIEHVIRKSRECDMTTLRGRFNLCLFRKRAILSCWLRNHLFLRGGHGCVIWALSRRGCWRWRERTNWRCIITFPITFLCCHWH